MRHFRTHQRLHQARHAAQRRFASFLVWPALAAAALLAGCDNDARVASRNLSQAADNFEINRRIVFYNGITGDYMLTIEGLCSQEQTDRKLAVTCKVGPSTFKKHFLGLSDNVTYFSEQIEGAKASAYFYRVTFKPSVIIPDIDLRLPSSERPL